MILTLKEIEGAGHYMFYIYIRKVSVNDDGSTIPQFCTGEIFQQFLFGAKPIHQKPKSTTARKFVTGLKINRRTNHLHPILETQEEQDSRGFLEDDCQNLRMHLYINVQVFNASPKAPSC